MDPGRTARLGPVFYISFVLAAAFVLWGVLGRESLSRVSTAVLEFVVNTFGWVYLAVVLAVLVFVLALAFSRLGRVRLGGDDERPDFGWVSWVAMLFSAGVGMSFLSWGTAEPLIHLAEPPFGAAEAGSAEAARMGMQYSFLFWGPHVWAIYAAVAIAVAYFSFRENRPVLISSALYPILGERVNGPVGKTVDVLAVFAILFGVATSLGLGTRNLNGGLSYSLGIPDTYPIKVALIAGLMTVVAISCVTGLGRGIRILSLINLGVCGALAAFVLLAGPTLYVFETFADSTFGYLSHLGRMSLRSGLSESEWAENWTFFFWAWWISWGPFVGSFIARISKGRTIREVVAGVVLVPSVMSFAWFSIFGGTALRMELLGGAELSALAVDSKAAAAFGVLDSLPLQTVTFVVAVLLLGLLFVTSADSASFMLGSTTSGGALRPPKPLRYLWSVFGAAFAAVLLLDGTVQTIQGAAVIAAVPFTVILVCLCVSLGKALLQEGRKKEAPAHEEARTRSG